MTSLLSAHTLIGIGKTTDHLKPGAAMDDNPPSRAQLKLAAEHTIDAAASAVVWDRPDDWGVLEHMASVSPERMAQSRCAYWDLVSRYRESTPEERETLDHAVGDFEYDGDFEVAALPATAVPAWAEAVREAMCDLADEVAELAEDVEIEMDISPEALRQALGQSIRSHALGACSYWGWDPLPLKEIQRVTQVVRNEIERANTGLI